MSTWTMDQVRQVERLWAEVDIDVELANRYGEDRLLGEVAFELARRIMHMAHPFGVEVDPGRAEDFEIVWEKSPQTPWTAKGRLRWKPSTRTVELRGGHLDGQRYELREIGEPFRVPRPAITPWLDASDERSEAALVEIVDTYEIVGWREDEHVWVYEAT